MTTNITPAIVAALSDAELNELAHRLIVGGGFPHDFAMMGGEHDYCSACGEKDTTDLSCRFGPDYATDDGDAFELVDAIRDMRVEDGICFLDKLTIEYYPATLTWFTVLRLHYRKPAEARHKSRARAITEACVLAAASKEQS